MQKKHFENNIKMNAYKGEMQINTNNGNLAVIGLGMICVTIVAVALILNLSNILDSSANLVSIIG